MKTMKRATFFAIIGFVVAMCDASVNADIVLEIDITNPASGFSIINVSGATLSPITAGGI